MEQESSTKGAEEGAGTGDDGQAVKLGEESSQKESWEQQHKGRRETATGWRELFLGRAHKGTRDNRREAETWVVRATGDAG